MKGLQSGKRPAHLSIMPLLFIALLVFWGWAAFFEIDRDVRTTGQIIASGRTQIIQAADGGVLAKLVVAEGEPVEQGQLLAVLEKSRAEAGFEESQAKAISLRIALLRARAEAALIAPDFGESSDLGYQHFIDAQRRLYLQRRRTLDQDLASIAEGLSMAREELRMNNTLFQSGDVSKLEMLRSRRQVVELEGRALGLRNKYRQEGSAEAVKIEDELSSVSSKLAERQSVLDHTDLTAPVAGIVKFLRVTTIGGVLKPGDELMQIAPTDDALIVEAKVAPVDIGQLEIGLPATIKIDAFDYSIYGGLNGKVTYISPDTLSESGANGQVQTYYRVHVALVPLVDGQSKARDILVKPGMTATVDIRTGTRSILKYLIKPVYKAFSGALAER